MGDDVLPHEDEREPPPHGTPECDPGGDKQAGIRDRRERAREEGRGSDIARAGGEGGCRERHRGQRQDDADRRKHGRCGKLPASHGLQPEIDEEAIVDEVSDRRGAEPERRERNEDSEPVGRHHVSCGLGLVVVPAGQQPDQDCQRAEPGDAEQAGDRDLHAQQHAVEREQRDERARAGLLSGDADGAHRCTT